MRTNIAIAVIVLFTTGMLLGWEIGVVSQAPPGTGRLVAIVVASRDIPPGTRLDHPEKWLTKRMYLRESAPLDAFSRLGDLRDQLVRERVHQWEPCTARFLAHAVPIAVPVPGSRAVTVEVCDLPAHLVPVLPGSRADLVYTGPDFVTEKVGSVLFVESAMILAVTRIEPATPAEKNDNRFRVTFALAQADANRVLWASEHGKLTLLTRRPNDVEQ